MPSTLYPQAIPSLQYTPGAGIAPGTRGEERLAALSKPKAGTPGLRSESLAVDPSDTFEKTLTPAARQKHIQRLGKAVVQEDRNLWEHYHDLLIEEEIDSQTTRKVQGLMKHLRSFVERDFPLEEVLAVGAKAGEAKRGWYARSRRAIQIMFPHGDDADRFTAILASTSPRKGVRANFISALDFWTAWNEAGRPGAHGDDLAARKREAIDFISQYNDARMASKGQKGWTTGTGQTLKVRGVDAAAWFIAETEANNVANAMIYGGDWDKFKLSGMKVHSFFNNLRGRSQFVTNDTWQEVIGQLPKGSVFRDRNAYIAFSVATRKAAQILNQQLREGEPEWTPMEVQETSWAFIRVLSFAHAAYSAKHGTDLLDIRWEREGGKLKPVPVHDTSKRDYLSVTKDIRKELLSESVDFARLAIRDKNVRARLEALGLGDAIKAFNQLDSELSPTKAAKAFGKRKAAGVNPILEHLSRIAHQKESSFWGKGSNFSTQISAAKRAAEREGLQLSDIEALNWYTQKKHGRSSFTPKTADIEKLKARGGLIRFESREDGSLAIEQPEETSLPGFTADTPVEQDHWSFFSPNTDDNLDFQDAFSRLNSSNHAAFKQITEDMYRAVGLTDYQTYDAIGDWSDGAESSVATVFSGNHDPDFTRYIAAWQGLLANQKAVLHFVGHDQGRDFLYQIGLPVGSADEARSILDQYGIQFRTIIPRKGSQIVLLYDQGGELRPNVERLAGDLNAVVRATQGTGEFIGGASGSSRTESRAAYRRIIRDFEGKNRTGSETSNADSPTGPKSIFQFSARSIVKKHLANWKARRATIPPPPKQVVSYSRTRLLSALKAWKYAARRAPAGGIVHRGLMYQGGKFIPNDNPPAPIPLPSPNPQSTPNALPVKGKPSLKDRARQFLLSRQNNGQTARAS